MATSYESTWQSDIRKAKVDEEAVSRGATGDEGKCVQNAVVTYSKHRPRKLTYKGTATDSQDLVLEDLVEGWKPSTHSLANVYSPDRRTKVDGNEWETYTNEAGKQVLWLACAATGEVWLEFTAPHVVTPEVVENLAADPPVAAVAGVDTIADEAPEDYQAIVHLAIYYAMQMAADFYVRQFSKSLGAGDYPNYLALGKAHLEEWERHMGLIKPEGSGGSDGAAGVVPYSGRVDWDSRTTGGSDRFAHRARWF